MSDQLDALKMNGLHSILMPEDCGLINGKMTLNGWLTDTAAIRGIYAPPFFSDNFELNIRFNGRRVPSSSTTWAPHCLMRSGRLGNWYITTYLTLHGKLPVALLKITVKNPGNTDESLRIQLEATGGLGKADHWGFSKPRNAPHGLKSFDQETNSFTISNGTGVLSITSDQPLAPHLPLCSGLLDLPALNIPAGETANATVAVFLGSQQTTAQIHKCLDKDGWTKMFHSGKHTWSQRLKKLYDVMPSFTSDNPAWQSLYDRSMLHFLLNEWNLPGTFALNPYYSTGGINGGCIGNYLWNYGEPYRMWSMLDPEAARKHLETFLKLDLTDCYAFNPEDGSPFGPYYPVNQEKIIFLLHAYVFQTGDVNYLRHELDGKTILQHALEQALMHDDPSVKAHLVDYGSGNHHLELRRELKYDGIVPDLNLRRCIAMHLAAELFDIAGVTPPLDLRKRAENLKQCISRTLFNPKTGWFDAIAPDSSRYTRYTMQLFKALGWNDWAMESKQEEALLKHLLNEDEFLGAFGIHSLSKKDPAYDEFDIDNGGPGACISFAPAIIDRLYQSNRVKEAELIFRRLQWLGDCLPYWGDSQRADIMEYRRDTPLQNDIQGTAIAQSIIFGMFGIHVGTDFSITITPHLPEDASVISLTNVRLAGLVFDVTCDRTSGVTVTSGGKKITAKSGIPIILQGKRLD